MTKLFVLGAIGAGAYAALRAKKATAAKTQRMNAVGSFDLSDLDEPVVVTEEVIIVTEASPYDIEMEMIPGDDRAQNQNQQDASSFEMPGRDAPPR